METKNKEVGSEAHAL